MSSFKDVTWSDNQDIDTDTLNQMTSNDRWLFDNIVDGQVSFLGGLNKSTGLKLLGGTVVIPAQTGDTAQKDINFGTFFSSACNPVVNVSHSGVGRAFIHVGGLGDNNQKVDNRGCRVVIIADPKSKTKNYFPNSFYVHFIALGF